MLGRREFALTGLTAIAFAAVDKALGAEPSIEARHSMRFRDPHWQACAKACSDCQRACDSCSTHCAHQVEMGHKAHFATLMTCRDCADFCATAAQIVARGGPFGVLICGACAEACAQCGSACEKFPDDEHMKLCAQECRKCEKVCREMASQAGTSAKS